MAEGDSPKGMMAGQPTPTYVPASEISALKRPLFLEGGTFGGRLTSHEERDTNGLNNFIGVGCGVSSRHVEPHVEFHGRFSSIFE